MGLRKNGILAILFGIPKSIYGVFTGKKPPQKLFRFYFFMILLGALLLMLPISNKNHKWFDLSFIDAVFTAASAFSDTGLTINVTSEYFSFFGQLVILLLIQLGGIGLMAIKVLIMMLLHKKIGISERHLISSERGSGKVGGTMKVIVAALKTIFMIEFIAAILLGIRFYFGYFNDPSYPFDGNFFTLIWHSIFHSISAVNNAGFDIIGSASLAPYAQDYFIQTIIMVCLILGGIGFPVFYDISEWVKARKKGEKHRFSTFTKFTIKIYFSVMIIGIGLVFGIELLKGGSEGILYNSSYTTVQKIYYVVFHTVSTRNAGFATIDLNQFSSGSQFVFSTLMWIGASPASTAGGVRTTTFWLAILSIFSFAKGNSQVIINNRRVPSSTIAKSILVVFVAQILVVIATTLLLFIGEGNFTVIQAFFEVCSAFGTTGLTLGITAQLGFFGKIVIIILMIIGQVGVSGSLLMWNSNHEVTKKVILPEEDIIIG